MLKYIITAAKGVIVGGTMLVPGVSGGSMAMILGIYHKLITAVSSFMKHKKESICLLISFCLGGAFGMILIADPLLKLIETFPLPLMYFFIGAVAGGIPMICREARIQTITWKVPVYIIIGAAAVLALSVVPASSMGLQANVEGVLMLIISGFVAAIALVLPGISVSYLLLLIGLYDATMKAVSTLYFPFLIPLLAGLGAGILLTTKLLEKVMTRYPQPTYLIILGFILGSVLNIFPGVPPLKDLPICLITFTAGFAGIYLLSKSTSLS